MNFKKRKILVIMTIIMITLLIGCGDNFMDRVYNDDDKIASDSNTFGVDESDETIEEGIYKGKLKLSGSGTIWIYESDEDFDLQVPYTLSVKSGKAKLVLISPNNTVATLVENTAKSSVEENTALTIPIKKGINRIKLVGYKKADIELELHIEKGEFKKISF
ncbi:50S ribosomal protein L7ae [Clostridium sp. UBA6640]|uniref:50S ribosomal protein L7ae n=1 Tax=Clostridium sp. UBA6640 TaxID=1946370 RepID=UPI0025C2A9DE|nr:50S ribosomal protein L7ae [Clostridium sp. UBA6640]